jgi:hypothetical protein
MELYRDLVVELISGKGMLKARIKPTGKPENG